MTTAFVLGGGGVLGAVEVGMLRALFERGITPDLVLGTSIGALNGALVAREPDLSVIEKLTALWRSAAGSRPDMYGDSALRTGRRGGENGPPPWCSTPPQEGPAGAVGG